MFLGVSNKISVEQAFDRDPSIKLPFGIPLESLFQGHFLGDTYERA